MAIQVSPVRRPQASNSEDKLLQIAGTAAGAFFGGPTGAAIGGSLAGELGSKPQGDGPSPVEASAIDRRMQKLNNEPLRQIRDSIDSLKYVQDDQQRAELAKPLFMADYVARNKQA